MLRWRNARDDVVAGMSAPVLVPNVSAFLDSASERVGRMLAERWNTDLYADLCDLPIKSPIEQLFYIACAALIEADREKVNPDPTRGDDGSCVPSRGFYVIPQFKVGKYALDFHLSQFGISSQEFAPVAVELDGHAFHDKNARQRAYEKARDRHLVKSGLRVLHYTGSEVAADPFRCATEALRLVGLFEYRWEPDTYCAEDPLQVGEG